MQTKNKIFVVFFFLLTVRCLFSQGTWTQKASYPTTNFRMSNFAFTINAKGYQGTGWDATNVYSDFWEYDPVSNSWTQKANFGGGPINFGIGMAIGSKGYAGMGRDISGNNNNSFWEYDPAFNTWTQKTSIPGPLRERACAFAIGTKGYVATGASPANACVQALYVYDPSLNSWTALASFPPATGRADIDRVPFVINNKAYLGLGCVGAGFTPVNDWWEYDPAANIWTQKANFPSAPRMGSSGFAICNKGYAGLGSDNITAFSDWYEYDPATNLWTAVTSFPAGPRADAPTFVIGSSGYIVDGSTVSSNLWEFTIAGTLAVTANPATICSGQATTITASGGNNYLWNTGATTSSIIVSPSSSTSYSVSDTSSACGGVTSVTITVSAPPSASVSGNTTICSGQTATLTASGGGTYSWSNGSTANPILVSPTASSTYSVIVSIGSCSDTASGSVTVVPASAPVVTGNTSLCAGDVATLTASGGTNYSWSTGATTAVITVNPSSSTSYTVVATNSNGCTASATVNVTVSPPPVASVSGATICSGQTATLTASGGGNYSWSNGSTANPILVSPTASSTYSVIVSVGSCGDTASAAVTVNPNPTASVSGNVTITTGSATTLSAGGGGTYSWSNGASGSAIIVSPTVTTTYCVYVSNSFNCADTNCVTVTVTADLIDCSAYSSSEDFFIPSAFSPNEDGENDVLKLYYGNMACIKTYAFSIYNRWGEKVFETEDPLDEWDGSYREKMEGTAVFAYYMQATLITKEKIIKKGNISLIK